MKRRLDHADAALWSIIAATVRPLPGRSAPKPANPSISNAIHLQMSPTPVAPTPAKSTRRPKPPEPLEPRRLHRLARGRDPILARFDLHGHTQQSARAALTRRLLDAHADGLRQVLVITGKGVLGDGVLRRRVPEWLAEAPLRGIIAGVSEAHRRHGGEGALYVALKRPG